MKIIVQSFLLVTLPFCSIGQSTLFQTGNTVIKSIAVSHDGRTIAVEGESSDVTLWDIGSRKKIMTLKRSKPVQKDDDDDEDDMPDMGAAMVIGGGSTSRMYFIADGQRLILADKTGAVVWNTKQEKQLYEIKASSDFFALEEGLKYLAVVKEALKGSRKWEGADIRGSENRPHTATIILYDIQSGNAKEIEVESLSKVKRIRFVPGTSTILVAGLQGNLTTVDYVSGGITDLEPMYEDDEDASAVGYEMDVVPMMFPVTTIAIHPSKKIVASSNSSGKLYIYDFKEAKLKSTIQLSNTMAMPGQGLEYLEFSPNGKYLIGANRSLADKGVKKQFRFWEVDTGKEATSIIIDPSMSGISFSADGQYFALTKMDNKEELPFTIAIYDANTLSEIEPFQGQGIPAFFPNDPKRMAFSLHNGIGVHTIKK